MAMVAAAAEVAEAAQAAGVTEEPAAVNDQAEVTPDEEQGEDDDHEDDDREERTVVRAASAGAQLGTDGTSRLLRLQTTSEGSTMERVSPDRRKKSLQAAQAHSYVHSVAGRWLCLLSSLQASDACVFLSAKTMSRRQCK